MGNTKLNGWMQYVLLVAVIASLVFSVMSYNASNEDVDISKLAEEVAALIDINVDTGNITVEIPEIVIPDMDNAKLKDIFEGMFTAEIAGLEANATDAADDEINDEYDDSEDFEDAVEDLLSKEIEGFDRLLNNSNIYNVVADDVDVEVIVLSVHEDDADVESVKEVVVKYIFEDVEYEKEDNAKDYEIDVILTATVTYADGYPSDPEVSLELSLD